MASRRPNSCPDAWKHAPDHCDDRPRSVLGAKDGGEGEESLDPGKGSSASENNESSKAKVNQWIDSKAKDKKKTFYHYPQRRVSPAVSSETSGMARPQTEPGRVRNQMVSDDVKTLNRQSVHDVAAASTSTGTKKEEPEEGWVMMEKSNSESVMPCDPEDETNVLVPIPNTECEQPKENTESEKLERTKVLLAKKSGTTFKVLPEARHNTPLGTGKESIGTSGIKNKFIDVKTDRPGKSMGNIMTFATSISKWKQRRTTAYRTGFAMLDPEHRELLAAESNNFKTEIPEAMLRTIKEEAYKIVIKTTQAYKSQVGSKHRMTTEAYEFLREMREELQRT